MTSVAVFTSVKAAFDTTAPVESWTVPCSPAENCAKQLVDARMKSATTVTNILSIRLFD
jgi:hypothetical protein